MTFTATESSSAPIVLGKETIKRPPIDYGRVRVPLSQFEEIPRAGARITFTKIRGPFVVTYHFVRVHDHEGSDVVAWVYVGDMVTWTVLDASN
jgi:hypothetical protein